MKDIAFRTIQDGDFFEIDRQIKEIKRILLDLPIYWGKNSPESIVRAKVGSVYFRLNGGASTSLYVKESGTDATGWVAK